MCITQHHFDFYKSVNLLERKKDSVQFEISAGK